MELIKPPKKHQRPEWEAIITGSAYWFSKSSINFFGSKVFWESLTYTETKGVFLFISEEDNFDRSKRQISIRMFAPHNGITTMTYEPLDLNEAEHLLAIGSSANLEMLQDIAKEAWRAYVGTDR